MSLFDQIGPDALRAVLVSFYDRVFADVMIGYLFRDADKARLVELEYQFTARALGADVAYEGRGMRQAHAKHPIMRGHFMRRNKILEEEIDAHAVPAEVKEAWMGHARALRRAILGTAAREASCNHVIAIERTRAKDTD